MNPTQQQTFLAVLSGVCANPAMAQMAITKLTRFGGNEIKDKDIAYELVAIAAAITMQALTVEFKANEPKG